jgi:predicted MFS family arabinose efflux permease
MGILFAIIQGGLTGRLAQRAGESRLILAGSLFLVAGFLLLASAHAKAAILAALTVVAFGQGMTVPSVNSLVSRSAPADQHGSILGVTQGFSSLARALGPAAGGSLYGMTPGHTLPYLAGAAAVAFAALLSAARRAPVRRAQ